MTPEITDEQIQKLAELEEGFKPSLDLAKKIIETTGVPFGTALIMAGDQLSEKRANDLLAQDVDVLDAVIHVGSFRRFEWVANKYFEGKIFPDKLFPKRIAEIWRGSDPDDTSDTAYELWKECFDFNGKTITDQDKELPPDDVLTVYRGQLDNISEGLSWTLDKEVALRFAHGASIRTRVLNGYLYTGTVYRQNVIAYITDRNEEELIILPEHIETIDWVVDSWDAEAKSPIK